jgi:hypothetical protein
VKVHLLVARDGQPIEFLLTPGASSDVGNWDGFDFDLPPGAIVYADRGYTDYGFEDELHETAGITLMPMRKSNGHPAQRSLSRAKQEILPQQAYPLL